MWYERCRPSITMITVQTALIQSPRLGYLKTVLPGHQPISLGPGFRYATEHRLNSFTVRHLMIAPQDIAIHVFLDIVVQLVYLLKFWDLLLLSWLSHYYFSLIQVRFSRKGSLFSSPTVYLLRDYFEFILNMACCKLTIKHYELLLRCYVTFFSTRNSWGLEGLIINSV